MTTTHAVPRLTPPRYAQRKAPARPVRVTIEGDAWVLAHNPDLLRIGYGAHSSLMVNAAELGVVVEDLVAPAELTADGAANTCTHGSATGVDATPLDDPGKVWRCDHCGLRWVAR